MGVRAWVLKVGEGLGAREATWASMGENGPVEALTLIQKNKSWRTLRLYSRCNRKSSSKRLGSRVGTNSLLCCQMVEVEKRQLVWKSQRKRAGCSI